jgi:glycosyltransferase involved in cell wall biosynthesis
MRILLDCRPLINDRSEREKTHIIISCVNALAEKRGVKWLILLDRSWQEGLLPGLSGHELLTRAALPLNTGWRIWYDWQIPRLVRKYRPDLLMTTGGLASRQPGVPQCVWMPGKADPAEWEKKKSYAGVYRKRLIPDLGRAGTIFCFSEKDKLFLEGSPGGQRQAGGIHDKIRVVKGAADPGYESLTVEEKEQLKIAYAGGKEYFLTILGDAGPSGLVGLLKAFSGFKKRQQSNMQLVLVRTGADQGLIFPDGKLDTYKYRPDVHVYDNLPEHEMRRLVAAAYALVAPFPGEGPGLSVLNAWKAGVPVITTAAGCLPEIAGDRVLYAQPEDPVSLASQLMLLYKDEGMRSGLIGKALSAVQQLSWEKTAGGVWAGTEAAVRDFTGSGIKP